MAMSKKEQKAADKRIEKLYREGCSGVQIDIMDIGKVFKVGYSAIEQGGDDVVVQKAIVDFVQTIRKN